MSPLRLPELEKKIRYTLDEVEEDLYAIIQDRNSRYLVKILRIEKKDRIFGQYLRSWEHPRATKRKFEKLWWDNTKMTEILGGGGGKHIKYEIDFTLQDIYILFKALENRNLPEKVRQQWKEWYPQEEVICT